MGILKNRTDINHLKEAARIAGNVCDALMAEAQPGVNTMELEQLANRLLQQQRSTAPFKQFEGFGHAICISLNAEVVNGPPSRERVLQPGDVVSIAVGSSHKGLHGKAARTAYLGHTPPEDVERLLEGTRLVIPELCERSRSITSLKELLLGIPEVAARYRLSVVENTGGCGIGKHLHEAPDTPNLPTEAMGEVLLVPGLAFTLMPMFSLGQSGQFVIHEDGWTQVTADGALSAHFADTCLMTDEGLVVLSQPL